MDATGMFLKKALEQGRNGHPTSALFEITYRCNAACGYCFRKGDSEEELSTVEIKQAIDKLAQNNIVKLTLSGGEIFIREDIDEIIDYACRSDIWKLSLFTNGTLMTPKNIETIIKHRDKFHEIQFSLFSHIPEIHDRYMCLNNGFKRIMENGERLRDAGIRIKTAIQIFEFNIDEIDKTIEYFSKKGFSPSTSTIKTPCENLTPIENSTYRITEKLIKKHPIVFKGLIDRYRNNPLNNKKPPEKIQLCNGLFSNISISPDGSISPCNLLDHIVIGNIRDKTRLQEMIINNDEYIYLKGLRRSDIEKCCECKYNNICNICAGRAYKENGEYTIPHTQQCRLAEAVTGYIKNEV